MRKIWKVLKCGAGEIWKSLTNHVRNEYVLLRVKEQRNIVHKVSKRKAFWICHILLTNCLLQRIIERKIKGDRRDRKAGKKT